MDKRILIVLMATVLVACSSPPKSSPPASSSIEDGSKAFASAGGGVTLATNDLDHQASPHPRASKNIPGLRDHRSPAGTPSSVYNHGLSYWIERLNPNGGIQRVSASMTFHSGDRIRIHARSNRPGYLYVVNQGSSGRGSYLYPASASASEFIESNRTYQIPVSGNIRFDSQPGQEIVWLFLSQRPLPVDNPAQGQIQPSGYAVREASYNPCGSKDLMVESPENLGSSCGAGSKDLAIEDDSQARSLPQKYLSLLKWVVLNSE